MSQLSEKNIQIDVVSDITCPWCYIGKRRLEKAIKALGSPVSFVLQYHPFELNPGLPVTGANQLEYLTAKFGGNDHYENITNRVTQIAATEGLQFNFEKQSVTPNTRRIHAVIGYAREQGKQLEAVEVFFKAYFTDGVDLSKEENIIATGMAAGLGEHEVANVIKDDSRLYGIANAEKEVQRLGIQAVPYFIVNGKYGISGAQSADVFIKTLNEISQAPVEGN